MKREKGRRNGRYEGKRRGIKESTTCKEKDVCKIEIIRVYSRTDITTDTADMCWQGFTRDVILTIGFEDEILFVFGRKLGVFLRTV